MTFVCYIQKKKIHFQLLRGQGCVESKNMKIHYELIKSINNPCWLIQMQGWCSSYEMYVFASNNQKFYGFDLYETTLLTEHVRLLKTT